MHDSHQEKGDALHYLFILLFCRDQYTMEDTGGRSCTDHIEPKRRKKTGKMTSTLHCTTDASPSKNII